jgi:hypothetical protein
METLTEMFDRMITGTKEDTSLRARLRDAKIDRLDSSTDVKPLLRSQTSVKGLLHDKSADERRQGRWITLPDTTTSMLFDSMYWCVRKPFDKGALARGGIIKFIRADGSKAHGDLFIDWSDPSGFGTVPA